MAKRFMKYDKNNPPAGCTADGVFTGGGGPFVVTLTSIGDTHSIDKTSEEIIAAYMSGRPVLLHETNYGDRYVMMNDLHYNTVYFCSNGTGGMVSIDSAGNVTVKRTEY